MLLDRERVKFWQKWVFGAMAVLMGASLVVFIFAGSGQGCGGSSTTTNDTLNKEIQSLVQQTTTTPKDPAVWGNLGDAYVSRGTPTSTQTKLTAEQTSDLQRATAAYERQVKLLAKQKGVTSKDALITAYESLAGVYAQLGDSKGAESAYAQLVSLDPKNADYYFGLGASASDAGDMSTAFMAYAKFIKLSPSSADTAAVKQWMKENKAKLTASPSPSPSGSGK